MPLFDLFWSMLWLFLWIAWIWLIIWVFIDIFRSHDLSGWAKALWAFFVLVLPFLGVFIYLIARGGKMQDRAIDNAAKQEQATRAYVSDVTTSDTVADEIAKLDGLRDQGALTDAEFQAQKAKLLA